MQIGYVERVGSSNKTRFATFLSSGSQSITCEVVDGIRVSVYNSIGYTLNTSRSNAPYSFYSTSSARYTYNVYFDIDPYWTGQRLPFSGSGTQSSPYIISSPETLAQLAYNVNNGTTYSGKYFKQTADINLGGYEWVPIGDDSHKFQGNYDGQNYKIYGMYINQPTKDNVGLFGATTYAKIQNIDLIAAHVDGNDKVGSILGDGGVDSYLINCSSDAYVTGKTAVGGIAGYLPFGDKCVFTGTVCGKDGGYRYGGIAGNSWQINNCTNYGAIICNGDSAGGIAGNCYKSISSCIQQGIIYAQPTVMDYYFIGLILGKFEGSSGDVEIKNCYALGQVFLNGNSMSGSSRSSAYVGAVLGGNMDENSFKATNCSGILLSNVNSSQYLGCISHSGTVTISGCYTQVNTTKRYSGGDFSGYSIVENMNGGLPMQNALYSIAVGGFTSSQITSKLQSLGYTYLAS